MTNLTLISSDTMLIEVPATGKVKWIAEYCTETELKMRIGNEKSGYIFTKQ